MVDFRLVALQESVLYGSHGSLNLKVPCCNFFPKMSQELKNFLEAHHEHQNQKQLYRPPNIIDQNPSRFYNNCNNEGYRCSKRIRSFGPKPDSYISKNPIYSNDINSLLKSDHGLREFCQKVFRSYSITSIMSTYSLTGLEVNRRLKIWLYFKSNHHYFRKERPVYVHVKLGQLCPDVKLFVDGYSGICGLIFDYNGALMKEKYTLSEVMLINQCFILDIQKFYPQHKLVILDCKTMGLASTEYLRKRQNKENVKNFILCSEFLHQCSD